MSFPGPHPVDAPTFYPGACVTGASAEDLVDFGIELPPMLEGGRFYLWRQHVVDAARSIGMVTAEEAEARAASQDDLRAARQEIDRLNAELLEVRRSVAITLQQGVVVDKRNGEIRARPVRGRGAVV